MVCRLRRFPIRLRAFKLKKKKLYWIGYNHPPLYIPGKNASANWFCKFATKQMATTTKIALVNIFFLLCSIDSDWLIDTLNAFPTNDNGWNKIAFYLYTKWKFRWVEMNRNSALRLWFMEIIKNLSGKLI